jgi:hypothetical protein
VLGGLGVDSHYLMAIVVVALVEIVEELEGFQFVAEVDNLGVLEEALVEFVEEFQAEARFVVEVDNLEGLQEVLELVVVEAVVDNLLVVVALAFVELVVALEVGVEGFLAEADNLLVLVEVVGVVVEEVGVVDSGVLQLLVVVVEEELQVVLELEVLANHLMRLPKVCQSKQQPKQQN